MKIRRRVRRPVGRGPFQIGLSLLLPWIGSLGAADAQPVSTEPSASAEAIAIVNGEAVSSEVMERRLAAMHKTAPENSRSGFDLDQLLFRAVNDLLIAQEARALEMDREPSIVSKLAEYRQELALRKLESVEIWPKAVSSETEIRQVFEEQYKRVTFRVVTAYELAEAEQLLAELESGANMEELAKAKSVDPYRPRGGLVVDIVNFDLQRDIGAIVFSLDPGELHGPIRTDLGWSIVRVESFAEPDEARFPGLQRDLDALIRQRKALAAREQLANRLTEKHLVVIDQEAVAALAPERGPDGRILPKRPTDPEAVVARIGTDQVLTADELFAALRDRWKRVRNPAAAEASAPIVLNRLTLQKLMLAEALSRGYDELPEVERRVRALETELLIQDYLENILAEKIEVTEEEKLAYYEEHREEFHRPPRVRLGQITTATLEEAQGIAKDLQGGADLAWLAESKSIDRLAESGGDRGWYVPQAGVDDFNAELMEAPVGTVLEPVGEPGDWVVRKVLDRQEQGIYPYGEISGNLRDRVSQEKFAVALDEFIQLLRSRAEIEVNEEALRSLRIEGSQAEPEGEGGHGGHAH